MKERGKIRTAIDNMKSAMEMRDDPEGKAEVHRSYSETHLKELAVSCDSN
jgi:hypothetical protein